MRPNLGPDPWGVCAATATGLAANIQHIFNDHQQNHNQQTKNLKLIAVKRFLGLSLLPFQYKTGT